MSNAIVSLFVASAVLGLGGCDSHDGIWGPPGGTLLGRAVISGATDSSGIAVSISDRNYAEATVTTDAEGVYSFWCGDDDLCRISAHADSTLEGDAVIDVRGSETAEPQSIIFTGLGTLHGNVTVAGGSTGNSGVLVALEGTSVTAITDDAGNYTLKSVPTGSYAVAAALAGHTTVSIPGQVVTYKATTEVPTLNVK